MSFAGLEGTDAWKSLSEETKTLYRKIIKEHQDDVVELSIELPSVTIGGNSTDSTSTDSNGSGSTDSTSKDTVSPDK